MAGADAASRSAADAQEKKRRADQDTLMRLIALQQQIEQLNFEIDALREQLNEVMDQLEQLEDLEDLLENGQFDPNNPQHAAMARELGLDPDNLTQDDINHARAQLNGKADDLQSQIDAKEQERDHIENEREQIVETHRAVHGEEATADLEQRLDENTDASWTMNDEQLELVADAERNGENVILSEQSQEELDMEMNGISNMGNLEINLG